MRRPAVLVLLGAIIITLTACGSAGPSSSRPIGISDKMGNVAHMNNTKFVPSSLNIQTGQSITLIADTFVPHIIANGTWEQGTAKPAREPGAPAVTDLKIGGNESATIGPFNTTGTLLFYCTIHPGMNLAIEVS